MRLRPADPYAPFVIQHPGPAAPDRLQIQSGSLNRIEVELAPGMPIVESIGQVLDPMGIGAAALHFEDLAFAPMRYVKPTYSDTPDRVAFYSSTHAPEGVQNIDLATATYGTKDGAPFIHCHAIWKKADGQIEGGHILPYEARLAGPTRMVAYATSDAAMTVVPDEETNFSLFSALQMPGKTITIPSHDQDGMLIVARIRPNQDLVSAIETICRHCGISKARVISGIGSTVGAAMEGKDLIRKIPTELLVASGTVDVDANGTSRIDMDTYLIDADGHVHRGTMIRNANPVLICFELFLEVMAA